MGTKVVLSLTILILTMSSFSWAATLSEQCSDSFTKLAACINFATGKASTPSKDCCGSVEQIKESNPVCLCYIILQTHNGSESTKNVGLQEDRLIQLPSACRLANASLTDCPKLLNIPTTSPDYAIFTNTTTPSTPSMGSGSTSPTTNNNSTAFKTAPSMGRFFAFAISVFVVFGALFH